MNQQTRRQFFKRIAATCAAVVMAPAVLVKGKKSLPFKPNLVQQKFMNQPLKWINYTAEYRNSLATDPVFMKKYRAALERLKPLQPIRR